MAMMLKQSTAVEIKMGPFLDETTGKDAESGLTISQADVRLAKGGGDWAQKSEATTLVHEEAGWYRCLLDATDTDTIGHLLVAVHESGALPVWREFHVLAANIYDSLFGAATDKLDVNVEEWNTTAVPAEHTAGYPIVTVKDGTGTGEINTNVGAVALVDAVTTVNGLAANTVTASAIADNAIDAGAIAADAITAAKIEDGAITANKIGTSAITATKIADGAIDAATFAAGAINAAAIASDAITAAKIADGAIDAGALAADCITAAKLAADVTTELQSGLATAAALDAVDNFIDTEIGAIISTLGTPAGASLAADIAAIEAQTDDIGAAGAGLTAVPWNAAWDAEVQSEATDALNAYDPPTNTEMEARTIAAASYATAAALNTVDDFLDTEVAAILAAVDTEVAAIKAKTDLIPGTIDGKTFSELVTLFAAVLLGKASGLATTTAVYRAVDDSKARITATVDADGNRSAVTLDAS